MKKKPSEQVERKRVISGFYGSNVSWGNNGLFLIRYKNINMRLIVSNELDWEHVSVSLPGKKRTPTWDEMCHVKSLFWDKDECVVQYHPAEKDYVNNHPYVLHLWKPIGVDVPKPPSIMVGVV